MPSRLMFTTRYFFYFEQTFYENVVKPMIERA